MDEATSALDTQTERDIQDSLQELGHGRSVITIAHRLSTIADADLILVLEDGRVTEQGTHDLLLARDGRYAAMWQRQSAEDGSEQSSDDDQSDDEKNKDFTTRMKDGRYPAMPTQ